MEFRTFTLTLMKIPSYLDYYYTVLDLTKFIDWNKNLHEVLLFVRVGELLVPVYADSTNSEVEFTKNIWLWYRTS